MEKTTTMPRLLLIFLLTGVIGWAASRRQVPAQPAASQPFPARTETARKPFNLHTPEDFARWTTERAATVTSTGSIFSSYESELADWSAEELRAALAQGILDPATVSYGAASKALAALMAEWTRRDPDAAWEWLKSIPSDQMRAKLGSSLARAWPAERAEEALGFVVEHPDYFQHDGGYGYAPIIHKAFESAAARGPAALEALMVLIRENRMQCPIEGLKFPPGFDFAAWARSPITAGFLAKADKHFFTDAWMNQSPEEAFDGLIAFNREKGTELSNDLFSGLTRISMEEPEVMADRARRIGVKTGGLPEEEQRLLIQASAKELSGDPGVLRAYITAIPDPGMRSEANLTAASFMMWKDIPEALVFLEAGSAPEERLALLDDYLAARAKDAFGWLNGDTEQRARDILASWNTDPARIDQLITTMKTR